MGFSLDFANMAEHQGLALSVTGVIIVFAALAVISIVIAALPYMMSLLAKVIPEVTEPAHGGKKKKKKSDDEIAIAIVLANHTNQS